MRHLSVGLAMATVLALGCDSNATSMRRLTFDVRVESDPGNVLSGVYVAIDGQEVGVTSPRGHVRAVRVVRPGQLLVIAHSCPAGYVAEPKSRVLRARRYTRDGDSDRVSVRLRCRPQTRLAVLVVRARGAGFTDVFIDGELATKTDSSGVAHLSRRATPGTEFLVQLAARNPNLRPKRTSRVFALGDSDEIFVFDQPYRKTAVARPPRRASPRIVRIE